jgi:hypothetical protein
MSSRWGDRETTREARAHHSYLDSLESVVLPLREGEEESYEIFPGKAIECPLFKIHHTVFPTELLPLKIDLASQRLVLYISKLLPSRRASGVDNNKEVSAFAFLIPEIGLRKRALIGCVAEIVAASVEENDGISELSLLVRACARASIVNSSQEWASILVLQDQEPSPLESNLFHPRPLYGDRKLLNFWCRNIPLFAAHAFAPKTLAIRAKKLVDSMQCWEGLRSLIQDEQLSPMGISLQSLSWWFAINLPLDQEARYKLLCSTSVTERLYQEVILLENGGEAYPRLHCQSCRSLLGSKSHIFAAPGSNASSGSFVNPHGFLHQIVTLTQATGLRHYGEPVFQHSWFENYSWQILLCRVCHSHVGWLFQWDSTAGRIATGPAQFYGLCRASLIEGA